MEEEIDRILNRIKNEIDYSLESSYNFETTEELNLHKKCFILLKTNGFIKLERNSYNITNLGLEVLNQGGWKKHIEFVEQQKIDEKEKERIEFEKSTIELRLKKWQLKTFWPIFIFALIGFGFSLYNFIYNRNNLKISEKQKERIEQMESELEKLNTSILNRKTIDSLKYSKVLKNEKNIEKSEDK